MEFGDKFFRIVDGYGDEDRPVLQTLYAAKLTPRGCWVVHSWAWPLSEPLTNAERLRYAGAKLVIQGTRIRYAYPTLELALDSYRRRKNFQIAHAQRSINRAKNGLEWCSRAELQDEYIEFTQPTPSPKSVLSGLM